jgi:regulator of nucleoside diphosphate kinase
MRDVVRTRSVPQIIVSNADYERLTDLATASLERLPDVANELLSEMDRAKVVQDGNVPDNVVRMGSTVTFKSDDGNTRTFKLVYPAEESLDEHRISVMTPVGAALIGLAAGFYDGKPRQDKADMLQRLLRHLLLSGPDAQLH